MKALSERLAAQINSSLIPVERYISPVYVCVCVLSIRCVLYIHIDRNPLIRTVDSPCHMNCLCECRMVAMDKQHNFFYSDICSTVLHGGHHVKLYTVDMVVLSAD